MYRESVFNTGVQISLTTGATLTLSMRISAPAADESIHITRITRSHHVSQSNDPVITLYAGTTARAWRARSQTPLQEVYSFFHPIMLPRGTGAKLTMTSSLATHTLTAMIHYFVED